MQETLLVLAPSSLGLKASLRKWNFEEMATPNRMSSRRLPRRAEPLAGVPEQDVFLLTGAGHGREAEVGVQRRGHYDGAGHLVRTRITHLRGASVSERREMLGASIPRSEHFEERASASDEKCESVNAVFCNISAYFTLNWHRNAPR